MSCLLRCSGWTALGCGEAAAAAAAAGPSEAAGGCEPDMSCLLRCSGWTALGCGEAAAAAAAASGPSEAAGGGEPGDFDQTTEEKEDEEGFSLSVVQLGGKIARITGLTPVSTLADLQRRISEQLDVPPENQKLLLATNVVPLLDLQATLHSLDIDSAQQLTLVVVEEWPPRRIFRGEAVDSTTKKRVTLHVSVVADLRDRENVIVIVKWWEYEEDGSAYHGGDSYQGRLVFCESPDSFVVEDRRGSVQIQGSADHAKEIKLLVDVGRVFCGSTVWVTLHEGLFRKKSEVP